MLDCSAVDNVDIGADGNDCINTSIGEFRGGGVNTLQNWKFGTENCTVNCGGSDTNCCVGVGSNGGARVGAAAAEMVIGSCHLKRGRAHSRFTLPCLPLIWRSVR